MRLCLMTHNPRHTHAREPTLMTHNPRHQIASATTFELNHIRASFGVGGGARRRQGPETHRKVVREVRERARREPAVRRDARRAEDDAGGRRAAGPLSLRLL